MTMNKQTEALKMAIEVMNTYQDGWLPDDMASAVIACVRALEQPAECSNGCPKNQVCDFCQGAGGKDAEQPAPSCDKVTRLEVIDNNGRSYVNLGVDKMELSYQDDGKTLKIFTNGSGAAPSWQTNKEFVLLSDDEIDKIWDEAYEKQYDEPELFSTRGLVCRAIEQALKEKNHAGNY